MTKIKSDGGHSTYYDIPLRKEHLESIAINDNMKLSDFLDVAFGGDSEFVGLVRSLVHKCNNAMNREKIYLTAEQVERALETKVLKIDDFIFVLLSNDFDYGTALKSLKRAYESIQGRGKVGADTKYNLSKVIYSLDQIQKWSANRLTVDMSAERDTVTGLIDKYS